MSVTLIPARWETERLYVRNAVMDDVAALQRLWEETGYIGAFDGRPERREGDMHRYLTDGDLPPDGARDAFEVQAMCDKATSHMIGYLALYHGYPDAGTLWVTFFAVGMRHQTRGYGQEAAAQLSSEAARVGYRRIRLAVALKNWGAIRFWRKAGYDRIVSVSGDREFGDGAFADLVLERSLSVGE